MHAKSDSEVTSLAPSSPTRSPRRPVYYVQSPSRDSHDGEKTSFQSTPVLSPMGSPPHSHSSVGRHSRESSTSRFSGSLKSSNRKVGHHENGRGKGQKPWKECAVIEEEGLLEEEDGNKGIPKRCYFPIFVLSFVLLFSFFALILWGAARPQKPQITMKSITFESFTLQAGTDSTGVPTEMLSLNSTLKLIYRNPATFFGVHVASTPISLTYYQLSVASGNMKNFYQRRKSQRAVNVVVEGTRIPLYGGGSTLSSSDTTKTSVGLNMTFEVRSKAYVLGKLVKPKFYTEVQCSAVLDQTKLGTPFSLKNSCQYDD
ncbi:hypothetical protein AMTRI_Chr11g155860 [Amborella trichopoda]|uniref:Uncharacterized protein n=1 Tax=Amborella trichopoda TaxID=13333 RepID=W1PND9_AMBTC|nr:uncharacterized protein LOC18436804 [Amborella trichopoda]ERN08670.1 hypothetical protein AMTR_s00017p00215910 [Amborella trichopoda]|eukprot:XP_006847089.1 uncharacterized protein LOC18436804 [Amborella trichopoda]